MSNADYDRRPLALPTGSAHTVKLPPRTMRGRLVGFLFETNKTFVLPGALTGISGLVTFYEAHPGLAVVVTGHTDTVGSDAANLGLSEERARAVMAFLLDDVDTWMRHYQGTPASTAWGTREDQHMLTALPHGQPPYYAGPVHGVLDAATTDAIKRFQADHGLAVDGVAGSKTRRALVTDYVAIDGTSLPAGTEVKTHGCGEHHLAVATPDNTAEQANRRVEVFFFEGPIAPPPQPTCPKPGCAEYPAWLAQMVLSLDYDLDDQLHAATVEVLDPENAPVADAEVVVQGIVEQRKRTAGDGLAQLTDLPAGRYSVVAHHPGFLSGESEFVVGEPDGGGDVVLAAAPGPAAKGAGKTTVALKPRLLKITYRQMFTIDNQKVVRLRNQPVEAGIEVTIGSLTSTTNASGVTTFDIAAIGAGTHRAVASARSVDKAYVGATGPLVLPRPAPKDDVLYRDMDIQFVVDAKLEVSAAKSDEPVLFAASTDGGVWREGPLDLLVDWKPVWLRATKHAPRPGNPHPNDVPNILVVHRTAGASIAGAGGLITGGNGTSAHYVVDVDGYVLKLVREDEVSNHAGSSYWRGKIGVNSTAVGIEIVSADGQDYPPRQMQAVRDLMWRIRRTSNIRLGNVVGHSEVDVVNTNPTKGPDDLTPGGNRPHDPGIEFDWPMLGEQHPNLGALGDRVALAADPTTVPAAVQSAMYGGYFNLFTDPWVNGDRDSTSRWGGKPRTGLATADLIAELQRDFKAIGYSIASNAAQVPSGIFDLGLARLIIRFKHRWFGGPKNKARWATFKDKPHFDRETAVMVKAVVAALRATP